MIVLGIPIMGLSAVRRRWHLASPWVKDIAAGVCFVVFTISSYALMGVVADGLRAIGWAE